MLTNRDVHIDQLYAASRKHRSVGEHVKTPQGHGHVASVHTNQTFYGVHTGYGVAYFPASQVNDPDHDGDVDAPGQPDNDAPAAPAA